jgi:hypothetical protein
MSWRGSCEGHTRDGTPGLGAVSTDSPWTVCPDIRGGNQPSEVHPYGPLWTVKTETQRVFSMLVEPRCDYRLCFRVGNSTVAGMETHGPVSAAEASAALASVERSRARVAWTGYPRWYWLATGAVLAALPVAALLPDWLSFVSCVVVTIALLRLAFAASRVRGVCEGWTRGAMRWSEVVVLYGPAVVVAVAGVFTARLAWWSPVVAAVAVFALFAGTGLTLSARAGRR